MGSARTSLEVVDGWAHGVSGSVVREDRVVHVEHIWGTAITITYRVPGDAKTTRWRPLTVAESSSPRSMTPSPPTSP